MIEKRCAIYTRKSHEEGLDQEYNTLDAQRDACGSYIKSQAHEGWTLIKKRYDDGGFSGGNLKRPALQELLQDVRDDKIDIIVVYKIDRLTRSLMDFSTMIQLLDKAQTSFVSVTQQFNTTSSMGRLTLNVLLSFAQFEREITGERIRDKIAAMRKRGKWTGGSRPLGYDIIDKKLVINEPESELVRHIFQRYLDVGSISIMAEEFKENGTLNPKSDPPRPFRNKVLYEILHRHTYTGMVEYKGELFEGEHEAIIAKEIWNKAHTQLAAHTNKRSDIKSKKDTRLLEGLLYDSVGNMMSPTYSVKERNRRYPYYVSRPMVGRRSTNKKHLRIPAQPIEELMSGLVDKLANLESVKREHICRAVHRITVYSDFIEVHVNKNVTNIDVNRLDKDDGVVLRNEEGNFVRIPATLQMRDKRLSIVTPSTLQGATSTNTDSTLIRNVARAYNWRISIENQTYTSILALAKAERCDEKYIRKLLPLAYLAPDIIESILDGKQPAELELKHLVSCEIPLSWIAQRDQLGFA